MTLLAAYNFDEASGNILDRSGNGRTVTFGGSLTRVTGHTNTGLSQSTTAADSNGPSLTGMQTAAYTIMGWVKRTSNSQDGWLMEFKQSASGDRGLLFTAGNVQSRCKNVAGTVFTVQTTQPTAGTAYHFACTNDGTTLRLYINGSQIGTGTAFSGGLRTNSTSSSLMDGTGSETWLDDARYYDTALDAATITTLMNTPVSSGLTQAINPAAETDAAQPLGRLKTRAAGIASETEAAQPVGRRKTRALGVASETSTAQPVARVKVRAVGTATETDTPNPVTRTKIRTVGAATETSGALPLGRSKTRAIQVAAEVDTAQLITKPSPFVGIANETDQALPITRRKLRALGTAVDVSSAVTLSRIHYRLIGTAIEADQARLVSVLKQRAIGTAQETDVAVAMVPSEAPTESVLTATNAPSSSLTVTPRPVLSPSNTRSSQLEVSHGV